MSDKESLLFLDKLDYLFDKTQKSRKELAEYLGIPRTSVDTWYYRNVEEVKSNTLNSISDFFNVKPLFFMMRFEKEDFENKYYQYQNDKYIIRETIDITDLSESSKNEIRNFVNYLKSKELKDK